MAAYSIHHLPACADYQGNKYPDRWEVVRKETWRIGGVPKTILHTIKEFFTRAEAESFIDYLLDGDAASEFAMVEAAERRAGAFCL